MSDAPHLSVEIPLLEEEREAIQGLVRSNLSYPEETGIADMLSQVILTQNPRMHRHMLSTMYPPTVSPHAYTQIHYKNMVRHTTQQHPSLPRVQAPSPHTLSLLSPSWVCSGFPFLPSVENDVPHIPQRILLQTELTRCHALATDYGPTPQHTHT